jgi:hypothetical protein
MVITRKHVKSKMNTAWVPPKFAFFFGGGGGKLLQTHVYLSNLKLQLLMALDVSRQILVTNLFVKVYIYYPSNFM